MAELLLASEDFVTDGERRVAETLRTLPDDWVVIANKMLAVPNGTSREIDFIVIGDNLVFVLDDKGYSGKIHGSDQLWSLSDGSSLRSPLNKIEHTAKMVSGELAHRVAGFKENRAATVVGGIVLSRATEKPSLNDIRAPRAVMLLDELVNRLLQWDLAGPIPLHGGETVAEAIVHPIGQLRDRIRHCLYNLSSRPKIPGRVGDYKIEASWDSPIGARMFQSRHVVSGPRLLTMYEVGGDEAKRQFFLHEARTLQKLRSTGVVPEVYDSFTWSEDFLVVPMAPPTGTSLAARARPKDEAAALAEVRLAATSFRALDQVHQAEVVHRGLNPDRIFVPEPKGTNDAPAIVFTGFFAARSVGLTIATQLGRLDLEDPYTAPEISGLGVDGYGVATAGSDTFSLALIWLERLSGVRVETIGESPSTDAANGRLQRITIPEPDRAWAYLPGPVVDKLRAFFSEALTPGPLAPTGTALAKRLDATTCAARLDDATSNDVPDEPATMTPAVAGTLLDDRYRVERVLGSGATARTYVARDEVDHNRYALKQFLRPVALNESHQAAQEFNVLKDLSHPNLPRVYDVYPPKHDVHVKMEYVEGQRLTDCFGRFYGNIDTWRTLAHGLLAAVGYLEHKGLRHRDIKPDNIIIRDRDQAAVLVDFGIAAAAGTIEAVAGTPGYLPPEAYGATVPPDSIDRYSAAVVLFRALIGVSPFAGNDVFIQQPLEPDTLPDLTDIELAVATMLLRAVSLDETLRPSTAAILHSELIAVLDTPDELDDEDERPDDDEVDELSHNRTINPVVEQILSLFRNSTSGNADNRGLDSAFARSTYIPTRLDTTLLPAILRDHPNVVFFSGNPGDGKTAFLERVRLHLLEAGATERERDPSGWDIALRGHSYRACYDASEAHGGLSADDQLLRRLEGLAGETEPRTGITALVAINDGRLADFTSRHRQAFGWLTRETDAAHAPGAVLASGGVWLVDLKRRAFVGLTTEQHTPSLMRNVLSGLVAPERWEACRGCAALRVCPIRRNAKMLAGLPKPSATSDNTPSGRLEHLLRLAHLRGDRHLTIRDLRSGLAYLITGGATCNDVHDAREGKRRYPREFWELVFTTDSATDVMLGELRSLDPARSPQPFLERYLYFHREPAGAPYRKLVFADGADLSLERFDVARPAGSMADDTAASDTWDRQGAIRWLAATKRRLFFHGRLPNDQTRTERGELVPIVPWPTLLPYRGRAGRFLNALEDQRTADELLPDLIKGIGRSDGLRGGILDEGLCLKVAHSDENRLTVLKLFPHREFAIAIEHQAGAQIVETMPSALRLAHRETGAWLRITLDVFETLLRLAEGQEPDAPELTPLLEDLIAFKGMVSHAASDDLYLIEDNRRRHLLTQRDGKIVLESNIGRTNQTQTTEAAR